MAGVKSCLILHWRQIFVVLIPLLVLPLPLVIQDDAATVGYLMIVMAAYWCVEALPLAVTGMIPIFFLPLTGILTSSHLASQYMKDSTLMFTAAIFVATGIEDSQLHRRIALNILKLMGTQPNWLMLGFMIPSWFLSTWIANTAAVAMMLPILEAVLGQLERDIYGDKLSEDTSLKPDNDDNGDITSKPKEENSFENHMDAEEIELQTVYKDEDTEIKASLKTDLPVETSINPVPFIVGDSTDDILDNMESKGSSFNLESERNLPDEMNENKKNFHIMCKGLTLAVAYSANVGGVATLTGTSPNIIMKQHADALWIANGMGEESPINWTTWLVIGFPVSAMCFLFIWIWLQLLFLGPKATCSCFMKRKNKETDRIVKETIDREYKKLGSIRYAEVVVTLALIAMVLLWFFRSPGFMPGWGDLPIFKDGYISDAVVSALVAFSLFYIPTRPPFCGFEQETDRGRVKTILSWQSVAEKYPWFIIFMIGGGYCLAEASVESGLSDWIGEQLTALNVLPDWLMVYILCLIVAFLTDIVGNNATTTILMPIMAAMAEGLGYNPIYLMLPVAITCSFAFMLPVGTAPNALAFSFERIKVIDMVKAGVVLNLLCIIPVNIAIQTWVYDFFDLGTIPWDTNNETTTISQI